MLSMGSKNKTTNRIVFELRLDDHIFTCYLDPVSRKNLNVTIKPNDEIWLSKPEMLSQDNLILYLEKNKDWIIERAMNINDVHIRRNSHITKDYVMVFGEKVYFKDEPDILDRLNGLLEDYVFENKPHFDDIIGKTPTLEVTKLKGRWGACAPALQHILLNERLVHYPLNCINYVMLHEYVHLIVPNHSKRFYDLIEEIMPDYRIYVDYMKEN